jgi:lysozyme family protein
MMTSRQMFEAAITTVLEHEGGYSDHPDDTGGATNFGISTRANPDIDVASLTRDEAVEIYWDRYWVGQGYDLLPLHVAIKTFDLAVNMGKSAAVCCLQRALRAAETPVAVDGSIGPETAGAAGLLCELAIVAALRSEAAGEYRVILLRNPSQATFASNWMARAYS